MDTGLTGARVLVTGGAGGIGAAICRAFAAEGASVAVHYHRSEQAANDLAQEISGAAFHADLRNPDQVGALFDSVIHRLGGIDICVAAAGYYDPAAAPSWEMDPLEFSAAIDANLTTAFLTARTFLGHAARTGRGSLVFLGSTAGVFGEARHAGYAAAKAPLTSGLLMTLKNEAALIGDGVRVNTVAPGWTVTPKRAAAGVAEDMVERATSTMARKQLASPEDVANQVVVIASDRLSAHMTGQVVTVAGGMEGRIVP